MCAQEKKAPERRDTASARWEQARKGWNKAWKWILAFLHKPYGAFVAGGICVALFLVISGIASSSRTVEIDSRVVQFGLHNVGELATQAAYCTNVQVIRDAKQIYGWTIPFTSSHYIFSYDSRVTAGVEFSQIGVEMDESSREITVSLPPAQVLGCAIEPESLEIYDESRSVFTPLSLTAIGQSYVALEEEARQRAVENGLIENARANAEVVIRTFLLGMVGADWQIAFVDQ